MRNTSCTRRGFTLVEVLIVVIILGILAALVVPQFTNAAVDARLGSVASQQRTVELQLELYRARFGVFPAADVMTAAPTDTTLGGSFGILIDLGYLKRSAVNPFTSGDLIGTDWTYDPTLGTITAVVP